MMTDPLLALSVAATVAEDVEVGTAVLQIPLYEPMDLAHRIFSLQQLSGGRFIFGVGAGSTAADYLAYGRGYEARFEAFESSLAALRKIFASGGLGDSNLSPWPAVAGGPPIFYGTWGKGVARAATEFDGWIASGMHRTPEQVAAAAAGFQAAGGGRSIVSTIQVGGRTDLGELKEALTVYAEAGFDDAVVMILPGGPAPAAVRRLLN
jgi:alkanesulfonate monooxygenase SsuD/methylene tetrahydromethanopterin reductase-like flavin-dependent oxidoreductase (luciferase family)